MTDIYGADCKHVLEAIPNFFDLDYNQAMQEFDRLVSEGVIKLKSISYNPSSHWSLGRHVKQYG